MAHPPNIPILTELPLSLDSPHDPTPRPPDLPSRFICGQYATAQKPQAGPHGWLLTNPNDEGKPGQTLACLPASLPPFLDPHPLSPQISKSSLCLLGSNPQLPFYLPSGPLRGEVKVNEAQFPEAPFPGLVTPSSSSATLSLSVCICELGTLEHTSPGSCEASAARCPGVLSAVPSAQ